MGIFHAVSAYCNAGFDLMGRFQPGSSLTLYATDGLVNVTLMALILLGGLGFFVWNDLLMHRFRWKRLSVHTRLVLLLSGILVLGGWGGILAVEWDNPGTLGALPWGQKILAALFQAVTTRTAGFYTVDQGALTGSGKLLSIFLMFVGGSSGSTAGGIKTVTVGVLVITAIRTLRGRSEVVVFGRRIPQEQVNAALSICLLVVGLGALGGVVVSASNGVPLGDAMYETVSAICTVGLSTGITGQLNLGAQVLLIVYMFFGRVGIMTISFAFMTKTPPANAIRRPETRVLIG
jgi:trk system potassium uptake protein TrkH